MKNLITILTAILAFSVVVKAEPIERVKNGFGATLSATVTPQEMIIRQIPNSDFVVNGTFTTDTGWTTNAWAIAAGVLNYTTAGAGTSTAYQASTPLVNDTVYRVKYTVVAINPTTNNVVVKLGSTVGTTRTVAGTYTEDLYQYGASNISFMATASAAGTLTIDNVSVRKLSDRATVQFIQMESGPTAIPIYFILNGTALSMTNAYAESQCMILRSNQVLTVDDQSGMKQIDRIWYRTASGSATAIFNGN